MVASTLMECFSMIINPEKFSKKYRCKRDVMRYLVIECCLPVFSIEGDYYYFIDNDRLRDCLKKMPLTLKILSLFEK